MTPDEVRTAALLYPGLFPTDAWQRHPAQLVRAMDALAAAREDGRQQGIREALAVAAREDDAADAIRAELLDLR